MALLLRDVVGLSYTEIADSLEITLATVKWRIYKAREEVATALAREGITARTATTTRPRRGAVAVADWPDPPATRVGCHGVRTMRGGRQPTRSARSTAASREARGRPVELERPVGRARTATTRRTSLCRLAGDAAAAAAGGRRGARRAGRAISTGVARGRGRRPGLPQPDRRRRAGSRAALGAVARAGRRLRRRLRPSAERVQVELVSANPTGPITVASARNGAYGDAVARLLAFAGHDGRARVLLQRRRRPDGPLPRVRRGGAPRRGAAGGRLPRRRTSPSWPRRGRPRAADARADRGVARAVPDPLRHASSGRARSRPRCPRRSRCSTRTRPTAPSGPGRAPTVTTRTASSSARTASRRTSRSTPRTSGASTRAASTG